jgi:hypothetical protein
LRRKRDHEVLSSTVDVTVEVDDIAAYPADQSPADLLPAEHAHAPMPPAELQQRVLQAQLQTLGEMIKASDRTLDEMRRISDAVVHALETKPQAPSALNAGRGVKVQVLKRRSAETLSATTRAFVETDLEAEV